MADRARRVIILGCGRVGAELARMLDQDGHDVTIVDPDVEAFRRLKPGVHVVNIARGSLIDQDALRRALHEGWIAGAALDVTTPEPLPADDPLLDAPNLIVAPHIGSATRGARSGMATLAVENVLAALADRPMPHPVG